MSHELRLEISLGGIWQLIRKKVFERGYLDMRLEFNKDSGGWELKNTSWQPLNVLTDPSPSKILRAVALILEGKVVIPEIEDMSSK